MLSTNDLESIRQQLDTSQIKSWQSILVLIVFLLTNINVLFPFTVPLPIPKVVVQATFKLLSTLRIVPPRKNLPADTFVRYNFSMNFVTAPLIANLLLLATRSIGRREVHDGIVGANNIEPYDIMLFFLSLAYIALSIDASGLIRYLAYRVLQVGGNAGHRLYLCLYSFFFAVTTAIGNDPVILSGTPFLAYMARVSTNISNPPRAWIYGQFSIANIASAILVSSNPTNLVIAGAFSIRFINYSANVIVPVVATSVLLFPCLLYVIFRKDSLIPKRIEMHQLSDEAREKQPVNPNIPRLEGAAQEKALPLEEIMNPYLDKVGAYFATGILAAALVTLLVVNAVTQGKEHIPAFWITTPAAAITLSFDLIWGWMNRHESRRIANEPADTQSSHSDLEAAPVERQEASNQPEPEPKEVRQTNTGREGSERSVSHFDFDESHALSTRLASAYRSFQITFPTAATVISHMPFPLVPFAFCMFILVQALVTKGWVPVFAHGWDAWVEKTGTVGAIGGMGFVSVIMCNFAGTNIGTAILLSRVVQAWQGIHDLNAIPISNRTFWGTVYSMILGVNYGAFSIAFSASLAGLLWRSILDQKFIRVRSRDFVWVNLPIITITMIIGCTVLLGQIYVVRDDSPYNA